MRTEYKPFLAIPVPIAWSPTLSTKAKMVWAQIKFHRNRRTGQCNPRYRVIAEELHMSEASVCRAAGELRRAGLLSSTKHIRASSYETYETPQPVKVKEKPVENAPDTGSRHVKLTSLDTSNCRSETRQIDASKEPDQRNLLKGNAAVPVALPPVVGKPAKKKPSAAAALPLFDDPEPASPPAAEPAPAFKPHASPAEAPRSARAEAPPQQVTPGLTIAPAPVSALAAAMAEKLLEVHPQPGLANRAAPAIDAILRAADNVEVTAERIWNNHVAWMQYWATLEAGRFIPQLWRWFRDGDWEKPPVIRKPAKSQSSLVERTKALWAERIAKGQRPI